VSLHLRQALRWLALLRPRHLRRLPLLATVLLSEAWFRRQRAAELPARAIAPLHWGQGLSVVIPERGGVDLLGTCLHALQFALAQLAEPHEVIVVVNGSPRADYAALAQKHSAVRWLYVERALGFTAAVLRGLAVARHGAVYLHNNDMQLAPTALVEAMRWRAPQVFSVATQILFPDDGRRREETGWTFMPMVAGLPAPFHAESAHTVVRGAVWAGAGAALFHAGLLRQLMPGCLPYDPFYWEDVDLGLRAGALGYDNLYCPASQALHLHRVTVKRFYPASEVSRIFERNRLQCQLRNLLACDGPKRFAARVALLDVRTVAELSTLPACWRLWQARRAAWRAPYRQQQLAELPLRAYRGRSKASVVVVVSPFALLPPHHGGALRTHRMASALAQDHDVILLSDESALYGEPDHPAYAPFAAVYRVDGRPQLAPGQDSDRQARMRTHAHPALRLELQRLIALYRPCAVLVEHVELAELVDLPCGEQRPRFLLNLHDVLLRPDDPAQAAADRAELALLCRFDARVVCSPEDQALLGQLSSLLVPNGCDAELARHYRPSTGQQILFIGPFRARINFDGICGFLREAYPWVQRAVPQVRLTVVGGPGAEARARAEPLFDNPSITVIDSVESVRELLDAATLTINPQCDLRGSSLKVLESLAAGRVCVSTASGARGHQAHGLAGLVVCDAVSAFAPVLAELLTNAARRRVLERPDPSRLAACSWQTATLPLRRLLAGAEEQGSASRIRTDGRED
jgi:GT2 family glycosyltransferase